MGRRIAPTSPIVTTSYADNMGNVVKTGRMLGGGEHLDTYAYDNVGNLLAERTAYTASMGGAATNTYTYDHAGRILTSTNALSQQTAKVKQNL